MQEESITDDVERTADGVRPQGHDVRPTSEQVHILVITDRDWRHPQGGGTGANLFGQVMRWLAWGHRVTVIACGYPGCARLERHEKLTIHRVGGRSTVFPHAIWRQWRGLVSNPDVVLEVINGVTFLTPIWLRTPRLALVHHIHRDHYAAEMGRVGRVAAFLLETAPLRLLYRDVRFMTVSHATAEELASHRIAIENIAINYNGVEHDAFFPGTKADEPILLFLGRLKRYKRIELILDAMMQVPVGTLYIVGDGDQREAIADAIVSRGLTERVQMLGAVDETTKRRLLQEAWVHVTASLCEGWGLSVSEAGACRTPTVATPSGGLRESVVHEETGVLVEDAAAMAKAIRRIVSDAEYRARLSDGALHHVRALTWEQTAKRTLDALRREYARKPAAAPRPARVATAWSPSLWSLRRLAAWLFAWPYGGAGWARRARSAVSLEKSRRSS